MNTNNIRVVLLTVVMLLTAAAVGAVNYPTYKPARQSSVPQSGVVMQSTQRVSSITPMLYEDGTAVSPYAEAPSAAGPRRNEVNPFTPGATTGGGGTSGANEPGGAPVGSAWVLLLFAMAYAAIINVRKKQTKTMNKKVLSLMAMLMMALGMQAAPAYRGWRTLVQPDGTTITLRQGGDEYYHFWEDEQGNQVAQDENGYWQVVGNAPTASQIQARRAASPRRAAAAAGARIRPGKGLIILVNYSDKTMGATNAYFNSLLNASNYTTDGATGSVREYFYDQSNGQYNPQFDVVGPVTLSNTRAYYGGNDSNDDDLRPGEMIRDACQLADAQGVDFRNYDSNNDGVVDFVYVIYAGGGEADGGPANSIWPHSWDLKSAGFTLKLDGKTIRSYACSAELAGGDKGTKMTIGTFCHEFSHVLGMPDYYDIDYGNNYKNDMTPGMWSIMDQGNYNNGGKTPPSYSTFDKYFMGWVTPENLGTTAKAVTLQAIDHKDSEGNFDGMGYQLNADGSLAAATNTGVQYYVENRQQTKWDKYCPGHGLLIWKVQYNATAWNNNGPNDTNGTIRYGVVSASGATTGIGTSKNGARDPFPGSGNVTQWTAVSGRNLLAITENTTNKTVSFGYIKAISDNCHPLVLNGTNCTIKTLLDCVEANHEVTATITPKDASYDITSVTVMRGATDITPNCTIAGDKKSLTIPAAQVTVGTEDITITAVAAQNRWSYYLLGEHVTEEMQEGAVTKGGALNLTITPTSGYVISSAEHLDVRMGGTKLEWGTGYTYTDGVLTISSVTGDVEIIVEPGLDPVSSLTLIPLTDEAQLTAGAKIILVGQKKEGMQTTTYVAGSLSGAYLTAVTDGIQLEGDAITVPKNNSNVLIFDVAGTTDNWTLTTNSKQLRADASSVYMGGSTGTNTWKIGVNSLKTTTDYQMYFNAASPRFKTYATAQAELKIYISNSGVEKPTATVTFEKTTDLTCRDGEVFHNVASTTYGTVVYSSSDETHAPVDQSGYVRPTQAGTYTITATVAGSDYYDGNSASYTLEVAPMPAYAITWVAKGVTFDETSVRADATLVLPNDTPEDCDNGKVFVGWTALSEYDNETTAPTYVEAGIEIGEAKTYYAVYALRNEQAAPAVTKVQTTFSAINGNVDGDENVRFAATQGTAANAPIISNNMIRIYQNGGLLTITAADGKKLQAVTIGSSTATNVKAKVGNGAWDAENTAVAADGTFTRENLNAQTIVIKNTGTTSSDRLNINLISVTYNGGTSSVYTYYTVGCGETIAEKEVPNFSFEQASKTLTIGEAETQIVTTNTDAAVRYTSSDETIATVGLYTGEVQALKAGTVTITAAASASDDYQAAAATYSITVVKKQTDVSFAGTEVSKELADEDFIKVVTTNSDGAKTYTSENTAVATVNFTTGQVTIVGVGTTVITADVEETDMYMAGSASYTLTVAESSECHVRWSVNGVRLTLTADVTVGGKVSSLPVAPGSANCDFPNAQFLGWSAQNVGRVLLADDPRPADLFTDAAHAPAVRANVTYYAVFGVEE